MKVLDATFLIDYLDGVEATREFYADNGGEATRWVTPVPALAEVLVGEGNLPDGDLAAARDALAWTDVRDTDERTAAIAGRIARKSLPRAPTSTDRTL